MTHFVSDLSGQEVGLSVPGTLEGETGLTDLHRDDEEPLISAGLYQRRHHHSPVIIINLSNNAS